MFCSSALLAVFAVILVVCMPWIHVIKLQQSQTKRSEIFVCADFPVKCMVGRIKEDDCFMLTLIPPTQDDISPDILVLDETSAPVPIIRLVDEANATHVKLTSLYHQRVGCHNTTIKRTATPLYSLHYIGGQSYTRFLWLLSKMANLLP